MNNLSGNQPAVSVILTVYNRAPYVSRCINSLLEQSFKDWELIAVDDGSTDNSLLILKSYQRFINNMKIIKQKNQKLPSSRNIGIRNSSGIYVTFLDSDDEYSVDHLQKRFEFMKGHPDIDLIHGGVKIIGENYVPDKYNPSKLIHLSQCTIGATFFGKRQVFEILKGFININYSEDSEFLDRAKNNFIVRKVDFPTYIYHHETPGSITNSYSSSILQNQI
jgi:glycosyltransferase involved in cell wall biosynthesis